MYDATVYGYGASHGVNTYIAAWGNCPPCEIPVCVCADGLHGAETKSGSIALKVSLDATCMQAHSVLARVAL